ncbi:MAG: CTP synthase [Candidatus Solincola sediminis]|uniref:CTP synthase n=1 Tax=Candidatus Solincola sediminis TaxID=1797199 RepID=A0A1F2WTA6_9ACTN|nr:MAG: CTP synthase [Candidatus Solincola sediminis]OFW60856.1 MAG: CTP synthase [Candidatus Solincola sediminis]
MGRKSDNGRLVEMPVKYIFVTGGVASSLGKGITAASLGRLLKARGLKVTMQKMDPYINVDPGTMNPFQHGEVFVTDDGTETDLDLGHYERFIDEHLGRENNVTTGSVYWSIITRERKGEFLGGTVQVIPHITNEIKERILRLTRSSEVDVVITEIGGTVGDIESLPYLEAIRQFKKDVGEENVMYVHVSLVPFIETTREMKTKPTQHSVKELRSMGIQPDVIVCRSKGPLAVDLKEKISLLCDIDLDGVISAQTAECIYEVPLLLHAEGLGDYVARHLGLEGHEEDLSEWENMVRKINAATEEVNIGVVGKYIELTDAYLSIIESLKHGGFANGSKVKIKWLASDDITYDNAPEVLAGLDGILIPGGFGVRGVDGKVEAIRYARENGVPFFGICLGLQCAIIEAARNLCGYEKANSSEFEPATPDPVIDLLPSQREVDEMGGTMRLGLYPCKLEEGSMVGKAYDEEVIYERHRHRYEVNNHYRTALQEAGLVFSGLSPDGRLVEIIERHDHPWFLASQFHPEFKSRPNRPHPLFRDFIGAALRYHMSQGESAEEPPNLKVVG